MSGTDFDYFSTHLLRDFDFIAENKALMYRGSDGAHCLLVYSDDRQDGVLVQSEGYEYARYAALLPNVAAFLHEQKGGKPLSDLNAMIVKLADYVTARCLECEPGDPETLVTVDELKRECGFRNAADDIIIDTVCDILLERPEIESVDFEDGNYILWPSKSAIETARANAPKTDTVGLIRTPRLFSTVFVGLVDEKSGEVVEALYGEAAEYKEPIARAMVGFHTQEYQSNDLMQYFSLPHDKPMEAAIREKSNQHS